MTTSAVSIDTTSRLEPLARLSGDSLREIAALCSREQIPRGANPFRGRSWENQFVYLVKGELLLSAADGSSEVMVGGSEGAAYPLGKRAPAFVSAKAITDIELVRIDDDLLDIVMTWDQLAAPASPIGDAGAQAEGGATDWRTMTGMYQIKDLAAGVFSALPPANIETLLGKFERIPAEHGQTIVRQGEQGDYYYVIERGRCEVTREVGRSRVRLAELKSGDVFGEEALLADTTRNATVTMRSDGILLRLNKADFTVLLREPLLHRISFAEARSKVARGAAWLDVRFPAEYYLDRIPGAINIPLNEIRNALALFDTKKEYIVYCQSGRRSSAAAFLMSQRGLQAYLLDGGLKRWEDARAEDGSA